MKNKWLNLHTLNSPMSRQSSNDSNYYIAEIHDISDDIWHTILNYCNIEDFLSIKKTCKYFNKMSNVYQADVILNVKSKSSNSTSMHVIEESY